MEREPYHLGPSFHCAVASAGAWARWGLSGYDSACAWSFAKWGSKLPVCLTARALPRCRVKRFCQVSLAVATCARAELLSRGCPLPAIQPSRLSCWPSRSAVGGLHPTYTPYASPNTLAAANMGVASEAGSCSKPAFIMEEINTSRVIFLSGRN